MEPSPGKCCSPVLANGQLYNVGDCDRKLCLLNFNDFSNVNKTRIKVLSSYLNIYFRCPMDKKNIKVVKNIVLMH